VSERLYNDLAVSRALNPECEHLDGDMRTVRLGRVFDSVLIQDAVTYMATESDLKRAMETAYVHCRPDGVRCSRACRHAGGRAMTNETLSVAAE
jgi:hypothetical protein